VNIKVLHVSTPQSWRGGERQLFLLCSELLASDVEQHVLCPTGSVLSERLHPFSDQISIHQSKKKRGGVDLGYARALARICKQHDIQLVHAHDSHAHTAAVMAADLLRNKASIVVSRRVDFPVGSSSISRHKYNDRSVKAIICVSDAIKDIVKQSLPNCKALITTVHSGVDLNRFNDVAKRDLHTEFGIPEGRSIVTNTSALEGHKDYPTFIRTIDTMISRGVKVHGLIFGEGSLKDELQHLVNVLGIKDWITFAGFRADILPYLQSSDVMLFPSKMEGLGTAVLDAFGVGLLVVATRAGGIPEMVVDGESGCLVDVGDFKAAADVLERVLRKKDMRAQIVEGARSKLEDFSASNTAHGTEEVYRTIISKNT